jgi:phosphoglycerate dehydrogenase-like enzyme
VLVGAEEDQGQPLNQDGRADGEHDETVVTGIPGRSQNGQMQDRAAADRHAQRESRRHQRVRDRPGRRCGWPRPAPGVTFAVPVAVNTPGPAASFLTVTSKVWIAHKAGLPYFEALPDRVVVEVADDPAALPSGRDGVEFWVPTFLGQPSLRHLAGELPDLQVVQLPSAGSDGWAGQLPPSVTLADARGVHDAATAEWVVTAMLASLRGFPAMQRAQRAHDWAHSRLAPTGELRGRRVLVIGAGNIGTAVARRLRPFEVELTMVARTLRPEHNVHGVADLAALLPSAEVVVLLVPLTGETRGLIDAARLAALPDGALVVNAARGPVIDAAALRQELTTGRLSAALDVTDPEPLPAGDPLWDLPNVLITPHVGAVTHSMLGRVYELAAAQARRYFDGEPLINVADGPRR